MKICLLVIGVIVSIILLIGLVWLNFNHANILTLESKWLIVAGIPILIALIVSGYISRFEGFGVAIEAALNAPVSMLDLKAMDVLSHTEGEVKKGIEQIERLPKERVAKIERLSFIYGKVHYYGAGAISEYLRSLWAIQYLEVKEENGEFVCLIPKSIFISENESETSDYRSRYNEARIHKFIESLERKTILSEFRDSCITFIVDQDDSLLEVLRQLRRKKLEVAVVLSEDKLFKGIVRTQDIERRIATEVLNTKS